MSDRNIDVSTAKSFSTGIVSYSLFSDFFRSQDECLKKLSYLNDCLGCEGGWGVSIMADLLGNMEKLQDEYWEKAGIESNAAGGNDVYVCTSPLSSKKEKPGARRKEVSDE